MNIAALSNLQLDALREAGNIGAGHAATALSKLLRQKIPMSVPRAALIPLPEVSGLLGGSETNVWAVYLQISGDIEGHMLFLLPSESAGLMIDLMMGQISGSTHTVDELGGSILGELGNILTSNYLVALADLAKLRLLPSIPHLAQDMIGAIIDGLVAGLSISSDTVLVIETEFAFAEAGSLIGYMLMLPSPESLERLLQSLGMAGN